MNSFRPESSGFGEVIERRSAAVQGSRALLLALHAYQRKHHPLTPWAMAELPE